MDQRQFNIRFSRHLILPQIGTDGQSRIAACSVLVVGAGGTASPCVMYLPAAGFKRLAFADHDAIHPSNLPRQPIHLPTAVGQNKAHSAAALAAAISPSATITPISTIIDASNAVDIISQFDIVIDATDNAPSRYLINDTCVILNKPLVSGSALRLDGQVSVYNHNGGPCYRCIFPVPPPPEAVSNCNQSGVLNIVPGIIGSIMALEAIKIAAGLPTLSQKLLIFDAEQTSFRSIRLRPKNPECPVCGTNPSITAPIDYVQFCGAPQNDATQSINVSPPHLRISVAQYNDIRSSNTPHILLDVRDPIQFQICALDNSLHIPYTNFESRISEIKSAIWNLHNHQSSSNPPDQLDTSIISSIPIYVICRLGNDSQLAVQTLIEHGFTNSKDIIGGLTEWAYSIDLSFPIY